jgi:glycosyltransferase involved in cell wall biosynthesis
VEVAMMACIEVLRQDTQANVLWIGEGPVLEKVKAIAKASENPNRIFFFGFRKDIPDVLQAADVLFMPSRFEGLPLLVLEALQAGIPLVASNTPGILEALPENLHARCSASDDIDGHVKNIRDVLQQPRQRIVPEDFLGEFSGKAFYQRILRAYQKSLNC